ncbi:MAG: chemotaxis protein CheW [Desulfuromonadaceae bacterium]|nr:chemotaxis protein CheW [Desulfuromonadaceae bacterium]
MKSIDFWPIPKSERSMDNSQIHIELACLNIGNTHFAVDIMRIREILVPQKLSPLPCASDLLEGVITLRGTVIPVMNMRKRFGMPAMDDASPGKLLVVSLVGQLLALVVDDVMEVISVPVSEITPPIQNVSGVGMELLLGVCLSENCVFMILDIDSLLHNQSYEQSIAQQ